MNEETVWEFNTARLSIKLNLTRDAHYRYDGDDEDGETQAKLDSGEYVAFDSAVIVELDGKEIAAEYLGGSVYAWNNIHEFWVAHRDRNPMNRNCSIMRAAHKAKTGGDNVAICHYFPDMVMLACSHARHNLAGTPHFRVRVM